MTPTLTNATISDISSLSIDESAVNIFQTVGYTTPGDSPPVTWIYTATEPAHDFKLQDADNNWWEGDRSDGVPVWAFGALAESDNEFPAIKEAVNAASKLGVWAIMDSTKEYVVDPSANSPAGANRFTPEDQEELKVDGRGCTMKFKDYMLTSTQSNVFYHILSCYIGNAYLNAGAKIPLVHFKNFTLDGNLGDGVTGGQPAPSSPSNYEQCALTRIATPLDGGRIDRVILENLTYIDPIADCDLIGPSTTVSYDGEGEPGGEIAPIRFARVSNNYYHPRTGPRAAIAIGSGVSDVVVENCFVEEGPADGEKSAFETEFGSIGTQQVRLKIDNCTFDDLEIGGTNTTADGQFEVFATNCNFRRFALIVWADFKAVNCRLPLGIANSWQPFSMDLDQCRLVHDVFNDAGDDRPRRLNFAMSPAGRNLKVRMRACDFDIDGTLTGSGTEAAIGIAGSVADAERERFQITLEDCQFDPAWPTSIDAYNAGMWSSIRCSMAGTYRAVMTGAQGSNAGYYFSTDDDWEAVTGNTIHFNGHTDAFPELVNIEGGRNWPSLNVGTTGPHATAITGICTRQTFSSVAPTGDGIAGEKVLLDWVSYASANSEDPVEWTATATSGSNANWTITATKP